MKGIRYLLFGLMFILIGGFGETALFIIGIAFGVKGLTEKE